MNIFKTIIFCAALSTPSLVLAQSNEAPERRHYDVEVIVFKNLKGPKGEEYVVPTKLPERGRNALSFSSPNRVKTAEKESYYSTAKKDFKLVKQARHIARSSFYKLLAHVGWRQPGLEKTKTLPVWIRGGRVFAGEFIADSNAVNLPTETQIRHKKEFELEGKITIALSRYLHTYVDLILRRPQPAVDRAVSNTESVTAVKKSHDMTMFNHFSLKEHRRMRSKTLHYIDSPEFGLLILITPVK